MPPILVTKPTLPPFEDYTSLIQKIWENRWLTNSDPSSRTLFNSPDILLYSMCFVSLLTLRSRIHTTSISYQRKYTYTENAAYLCN